MNEKPSPKPVPPPGASADPTDAEPLPPEKQPVPVSAPAAPPAASVVIAAPASEDAGELVRLRQERDTLSSVAKDRERRISELEDENKRLKFPPTPAETKKRSWLDGLDKYFPAHE